MFQWAKNLNLRVVTDKLQGKSTMFFVGFFITGNILQYLNKLDATWITFMTALLGYVVGHSFKEDKHEQNMAIITGKNNGDNGAGSPPLSPPS